MYAELRNLIDLAVAAAYIQHEDFYGKAEWKMDLFGNEKAFPVETYDMPKQVATAVNAIWKGHKLMTPVGGGVHIEPDPGPGVRQPAVRRGRQGRQSPPAGQDSVGQGPMVVGLTGGPAGHRATNDEGGVENCCGHP